MKKLFLSLTTIVALPLLFITVPTKAEHNPLTVHTPENTEQLPLNLWASEDVVKDRLESTKTRKKALVTRIQTFVDAYNKLNKELNAKNQATTDDNKYVSLDLKLEEFSLLGVRYGEFVQLFTMNALIDKTNEIDTLMKNLNQEYTQMLNEHYFVRTLEKKMFQFEKKFEEIQTKYTRFLEMKKILIDNTERVKKYSILQGLLSPYLSNLTETVKAPILERLFKDESY